MTDRPPSPPNPTPARDDPLEDRVVATTAQLSESIADALGCRLADATLETLLLELDRHGFVDWVTVTRTGDYVWDLSETPDRLGDAVADALVARLEAWLASSDG
ncbi:hypothetical protein C488_12698 [Natrinema pellirubrum DSM 15624]|uniref:Uncharacterized protein n=1 Tax=Natrinema pellirubrum (strain DSM 15624 / CIP 106293 / JCM 10476 / NCIMB 786 / 157) TaxID=797303 RepID=L0JNV6_NATP1|nr:hypothetical protein [Natrinema pellirubrum]AGB32523.1 hypothetical protein Natpe_2717 [Natrinema pellirubrum DSM 15624]ELY73662.1 hypothetical protein C488_12698 [Natrinema pellirubrum DSM 15624]